MSGLRNVVNNNGTINGISLAALGTGLLKNTTGTGVPSIAIANTDYLPADNPVVSLVTPIAQGASSTILALSSTALIALGQVVAGGTFPNYVTPSSTVTAISGTTSFTNATTTGASSGQKVIAMTSTAGIVAGLVVVDTTTPAAIGANNTVASIVANTSITLTNNLAANVVSADVLTFYPTVTLNSVTGGVPVSTTVKFYANPSNSAGQPFIGSAVLQGGLTVGGTINATNFNLFGAGNANLVVAFGTANGATPRLNVGWSTAAIPADTSANIIADSNGALTLATRSNNASGITFKYSNGAAANGGVLSSSGLWQLGPSATTGTNASLSLVAGSTTVAPLKLLSGTNLTSAVNGCLEYDGTTLFFTRAATTRESVLTSAGGASAPSTTVTPTFTSYYGTGGTVGLSTPNNWVAVVIGGTTYKLPAYT